MAARGMFLSSFIVLVGTSVSYGDESSWVLRSQVPRDPGDCTLVVTVVDSVRDTPLPVRVIVTDADGHHYDGSQRGLYSDGRFFADGRFEVDVPPGDLQLQLSHGPNYVPLAVSVVAVGGQRMEFRATLASWFRPEDRGWFGGDNHVHAQHDQNAAVQTDLRYAALQARAAGLSFITEAGSSVAYDDINMLDTESFLLRYAPEIRPGPYVGHLNTPGIVTPLDEQTLRDLTHRPLPVQAVTKAVRDRGGIVIHTHPMTPVHQLHWMGAAEVYADAVLGSCTDLFDVDARHTERLWFAMLNLGNRVGVSSYTDSALGRTNTRSPGDRRVYCHADRLEYTAIVEAMRRGRTMATSGGAVFVFLDVNGHEPGEEIADPVETLTAQLEVQSLQELREVTLYGNGIRIEAFDVSGKKGPQMLRAEIPVDHQMPSWLVARAEDVTGNWCLTSPVYLGGRNARQASDQDARSIVLEINNATRFVQLRPHYYAHLLVTVPRETAIDRVQLMRGTRVEHEFLASAGNHLADQRLPVTEIDGDYQPGWLFYPHPDAAFHFQADWPVTASGWYSAHVTTTDGRVFHSDAALYEASHPSSHTLSIANLNGNDTELSLWGYGEETEIRNLEPPYDQAEWWYPKNTYWRLRTRFGDHVSEVGWPTKQAVPRFR